jgi:hypothetical protein
VAHADTDPTGVGGQIVDAILHRPPHSLDQKIMHATLFGLASRTPFRPAFLKSPTSSFFFVSTEITGSCAGNAAVTL